jgi:hypothetical protein
MAMTARRPRATAAGPARRSRPPGHGAPNPLARLERLLERDEADLVFFAGNVVLVALDIIEWPVAALTLAAHAMARSRLKALQGAAEVVEEAG